MIDLIKALNALLNFVSLILISYFFDSEILFIYVSINSLCIIISLIFDRGLSHLNSNTSLSSGVFFSSKSKLHSKTFLIFLIFITILVIFYVSLFHSIAIILIFSLALALPTLYFLRWRLVNIKDGNFVNASLYSELYPTFIKLFFIPLIFISINIYLIFFFVAQCLLINFLHKKYPIKNIFIIVKSNSYTHIKSRPYINYLYALSGGVKNFGISAILFMIDPLVAASLFIVSRISQIGVVLMSGIYFRIPSKLLLNNKKISNREISKLATFNALFFLCLIIFADELFNLLNILFYSIKDFHYLPLNVFIIILAPVLINFYSQFFLSAGRTHISLFLDLIYISILIYTFVYYGYI